MTAAARVVLADCDWALSRHAEDLRFEALRVSWISIVTLLRAVGHVLKKVDEVQSPYLKDAIEAWWRELNRTKPEPAIYWRFIDDERNSVLKQYKFGLKRWARAESIENGSINAGVDVTRLRSDQVQLPGWMFTDGAIAGGPFVGQSDRAVAQQAVAWWTQQLDAIDRESAKARKAAAQHQ